MVQDTGFSDFIPTGHGLFAFSDLDQAENAIDVVESDYHHLIKKLRANWPVCVSTLQSCWAICWTKLDWDSKMDERGLAEITGGWDYGTLPKNVHVGEGCHPGTQEKYGSISQRAPTWPQS